jgi:adenine-specific DNA-methyltransferase
MVKYLGSKRTLIQVICGVMEALSAAWRDGPVVLDLFSGTSRVGHALKRAGWRVLANDHNAYAHALGMCYVQADREEMLVDAARLVTEFNCLARASCEAGWFTRDYCERSRYFQPANGARIEAVREAIARKGLGPELEAVMLVSLMEAADRVDSTTGVQMAYLKKWAPRAHNHLELRVPDVLPRAAAGKSLAFQMDALDAVERLEADVAYIDPPYNQHSYLGNYHVWETLVRWDRPEVYGIACKRVDCRERKSAFNSKVEFRAAMRAVIERVRARVLVVSFSDEGYIAREEMEAMLACRGPVVVIENDFKRYVGAQIGIYSPSGQKVGKVSHLRNTEYLFVAGQGVDEALIASASPLLVDATARP